jgi:GLPGLI family protein
MKHLLLSILFLAVVGTSIAQTTGQISYSMDFSTDNPEMAMAIPMMQGSTMELFFMPDKSKIEMTMGTFMKMNTVADTKADKGLMLMEVMGNKTATEMKLSDADKTEKAEEPKIEVTSETKNIVGYKCTKTIYRDAEGNETIMWIATDLKASLKGQQQFGNSKINGVPLEFSTVNNGMSIHFVATKFNKKVDKKVFGMDIPEGYTVVSADELKNMGGGE